LEHWTNPDRERREQQVAFLLAKLTLEKYFRWDGTQQIERTPEHQFDSEVQAWLFPQVLQVAKQWLRECVRQKSGTFVQMLLLNEFAHDASDCIYRALSSGETQQSLKPILRPYDTIGSTKYVDFDTSRPVYTTDSQKCHISHVVADTNSWEQKMAQVLEDMEKVVAYVKNQNLGFMIPYTIRGQSKNYLPDFIVRIDDGGGADDLLNLIVEVSGQERIDKTAKVSTAKNLWIPAVNQHGGFGRWAFIEITEPWNAENEINAYISR
jgi:type III restriction enzyme